MSMNPQDRDPQDLDPRDLDADALLSRVTELGVRLWAEGGSLCYDAPSAVATPELLTALRGHRASLLSSIGAGVERRGPMTSQQRRFIQLLQHSAPQAFNVATRITFRGPLDAETLQAALSALVARHETLRTRYVMGDRGWWQDVLRPKPVELAVHDLTALADDARDAEIEHISARLANAPFDLSADAGPVFQLLRAEDRRWVLLFVLHHVSCDAWGLSVLLRELAALYAAAGGPDNLERPVQPIEYALWQREQRGDDERRLGYWSRRLEGALSGVHLPTDRPRPSVLSGRGDVVLFTVPADVRTRIEAYARRHGTTPFSVTTAAFGLLLARLSGQQDIMVSVPYANRERRAHENLVACLAMMLALRIRVAEAESFAALAQAVARDVAGAMANAMPLAEVTAKTGREPIPLPVGFQYLDSLETDVEFPGMTVAVEDLALPIARAELYAGLIPAGALVSGYAEYSTDLWDRETVGQWMNAYRELLCDVVADQMITG